MVLIMKIKIMNKDGSNERFVLTVAKNGRIMSSTKDENRSKDFSETEYNLSKRFYDLKTDSNIQVL